MRVDANVSLRPVGSDVLGTRTEIKNINGLRHLQHAIGPYIIWHGPLCQHC